MSSRLRRAGWLGGRGGLRAGVLLVRRGGLSASFCWTGGGASVLGLDRHDVTFGTNICSHSKGACVRVLGVDPGLTRCGLGVVDGLPGRRLSLVDVGVVRSVAQEPLGDRLLAIETAVEEWIGRYRPDAVAVERVFSQHNVRTVMGTAQASGVAILVAARAGCPVAMHTPSEVKAAVTGNGSADKVQVASMVTRLLRLPDRPRPADAADALALAICHVWRGSAQARLRAAVAAETGG